MPHSEAEKEGSDPVLQNHDAPKSSTTQTPPLHDKHEGEDGISSVPEIEPEPVQVQPPPPTPPEYSPREDSISQQQQPLAEEEVPERFMVPSDVSSAINASRVTRLCCSVIVALLVVASYLGFSLIKSVISFRPLYLVLLTNSTVVVARLFVSGKQIGFGRSRRRQNNDADSSSSSSEWDAQLAKTLEIGLVVQSVLDAVFMDCAVYAIVLICGLSLVHV